MAYFDGRIVSGIDAVLDAVEFDVLVADADLVITGEGKLDSQSLSGKAVSGISRRVAGKPLVAIVGRSDLSDDECSALGLAGVAETGYDGDYREVFSEVVKRYL